MFLLYKNPPPLRAGGLTRLMRPLVASGKDSAGKNRMMGEEAEFNSKPKGKGGRPKMAKGKSCLIMVRMTKEEKQVIYTKARSAGMKPSEWFRRAAVSANILTRFSAEEINYLRMLTGMANNLNQLTKLAHKAGLFSMTQEIRNRLEEIKLFIEKLYHHDRKTDNR
jgi:hypothetical protein